MGPPLSCGCLTLPAHLRPAASLWRGYAGAVAKKDDETTLPAELSTNQVGYGTTLGFAGLGIGALPITPSTRRSPRPSPVVPLKYCAYVCL